MGEVSLAGHSLLGATLLIAFVDGFNPCSFWVLTLLLGIVIHSGSRGRALLVGGTFLTVTAMLYGVFIAGLFAVLAVVGVLWWVRVLVALLAGAFGVINVKDYFWFGSGLSLTIPAASKPGIYRGIRALLEPDRSPLGAVVDRVRGPRARPRPGYTLLRAERLGDGERAAFPLVLLTGDREKAYHHSRFREQPWARRVSPLPTCADPPGALPGRRPGQRRRVRAGPELAAIEVAHLRFSAIFSTGRSSDGLFRGWG